MRFDPAIFKSFIAGERPNEAEFHTALSAILAGKASSEQISAFLLGLEMTGLSAQELRIGTKIMRDNMFPVEFPFDVIDIVGTGGTGLHTLSISTASAIVCAGAGAKVAKHGNRAASSLSGTADTLSELGVELRIKPACAEKCVIEAGLGFLFAPNHHPAMRFVGPARKALSTRTLFNMLGPMSNPANARHMLLGVCDDSWRAPMAEALAELNALHVWVVHGEDGMDEITTTGKTFVSEVKTGKIREFTISPDDYGIKKASMDDLRGGNPEENAARLSALLDGQDDAYRDIVRLNSGAALMIAGVADTIEDGISKAETAIDSGAARSALDKLIEVSNS